MTQKMKKMSLMALMAMLLVTLCAFLFTSFSSVKVHAIANGDTGFSIPSGSGTEPSFVNYTITQDTTNINNFQYLMFSKNASLSEAVDLTGVEYIGFRYQTVVNAPSFIVFMDSQNGIRAGTNQGAPDGAKYYYANSSGTVIESVTSYGHLWALGGQQGFDGIILVPMSLLVPASGFDITHVARIGLITDASSNYGEVNVGSFYAYKGDPTLVQPEIIYNVDDQNAFAFAMHSDMTKQNTATYVNNNTSGGGSDGGGDTGGSGNSGDFANENFILPSVTGQSSFVKYIVSQDTTNTNNFQYLMFSKNASMSLSVDLTGVEYIAFRYQAIAGTPSFIFFMDSQNGARAGTNQGAPEGAKYYCVTTSGVSKEGAVSYGHLATIGGEQGFDGFVIVPISYLVQATGFDITTVARIGFITDAKYNFGEVNVGTFYAYKGDPTSVQPEIIYNVDDQNTFAYALHHDVAKQNTATYINNASGGVGVNGGDWYNSTSKVAYNSDQTLNLIGPGYLDRNLFDSNYYHETGKIDIEIKFSIVSKPGEESTDNRFGLFLRNKPIASISELDNFGTPGSAYKGAFFATFPSTQHYIGLNHMGVIVADYGYPYSNQYPVNYNDIQTVRFEITEASFNIYLNDLLVGVCRDESTGLAATVDSMKDTNGNVQAYLGVTNTGGNYNLKIYSVITKTGTEMQNYGSSAEWHGDKGAVQVIQGKEVKLSNGKVFTNDYVDISEGIQCDFEITSIPGTDVQNSGMSIYIKTDTSTSHNGTGFQFNLKAVAGSGEYRTQLTIGFIHNGKYYPIMSGLYPIDAVDKHYVAIVVEDNVWKCVFDGYSGNIDDLEETAKTAFNSLAKDKMKVVFETDNYDAFLEQNVGSFTANIGYPQKPTSADLSTNTNENQSGDTQGAEENSGCGSKIDACGIAMILIVPLVLVMIKKKKGSIKG